MSRTRSAFAGLLLIILFYTLTPGTAMAAARPSSSPAVANDQATPIRVRLSASRSTVSWDARDRDRERFDLPLLFLHREKSVTTVENRTLEVTISGLAVGTEFQIEAVSHHIDVNTGKAHTVKARFSLADHHCTGNGFCRIWWTVDASQMPSDFYHLFLRDTNGDLLWSNPHTDRPDFVALDTWHVALGEYTLRIYYGTLFPFARGPLDHDSRLAPDAVRAFIGDQFVKIIQETWRAQVEEWAFGQPLRRDWDSDEVIEVFITPRPLALFDGTGTYSLLVDSKGNAYPERRIWWQSDAIVFQRYDTLANAYRVVFAHEFFHLLQWNVLLSTPQPAHFWRSFVEGQANLAQSVQYPELELDTAHVATRDSSYASSVADFLKQRLNDSYQGLEADTAYKYTTALYWRFLYEQYGGFDIVRAALEAMVAGYDSGVVGALEPVMDRALAQVDGPFQSFEESLVAFARANYALHLENGRCSSVDISQCHGLYYDPAGAYADPTLEAQLYYDGARLAQDRLIPTNSGPEFDAIVAGKTLAAEGGDGLPVYTGGIPASYGMDFIEIRLSPTVQGRALALAIQGEEDVARFDVQVWKLGPGMGTPRAVVPEPEDLSQGVLGSDGHMHAIPRVDTTGADRLAIIITRVDPNEAADKVGAYRISVR